MVITTTPSTHYELSKLCLEHGKHVIVEKPFTPTSAEAEKLIRLAKQKKCLLTVYQNRRWDTDFLLLSEKIKSGAVGRVVDFESHYDRHRPLPPPTTWKSKPAPGNGAIYDLGSHLLDQIVCLFGVPDRVTAFLGSQRSVTAEDVGAVEDSFTVLLHYDQRGLIAIAKAGVVSAMPRQLRFWVRGTEGSFQKYNIDCQEDQLKAGMKPTDPGFGKDKDEDEWDLYTTRDGQLHIEEKTETKPVTYMGFYEQFARALSGEGDVPVDAQDARNIIWLIEVAKLSSQEGRTIAVAESWKDVH